MRLCIVPMKPLARAKARLAGALSPEQRRRLSLAMLADVVSAASAFDAVWVLNSDPDAAAIALAAGAQPRQDPTPDAGLNASLDAATADAIAEGVTGILIVAADLPAVTPADLAAVGSGAGVALAPDRAGTGTNALWRAPGDVIPSAYEEHSRTTHEQLARAAGVPFRLVERPALALDIDRAEDLAAARGAGAGPATGEMLTALGF